MGHRLHICSCCFSFSRPSSPRVIFLSSFACLIFDLSSCSFLFCNHCISIASYHSRSFCNSLTLSICGSKHDVDLSSTFDHLEKVPLNQLLQILQDPWIQQAEKSLLANGRPAPKNMLPTTTPVAAGGKMDLFLVDEELPEEEGKYLY